MRTSRSLISVTARFALTALLMAGGMSAFAAATWDKYNLSSGCPPKDDHNASVAVSTCDANLPTTGTLELSAWSTAPSKDNEFRSAQIFDWGDNWDKGLGIVANTAPLNPATENEDKEGPGSIDNAIGIDAMLFRFGTSTKLTSLQIGRNATDSDSNYETIEYLGSDLSIFAWVGDGTPFTGPVPGSGVIATQTTPGLPGTYAPLTVAALPQTSASVPAGGGVDPYSVTPATPTGVPSKDGTASLTDPTLTGVGTMTPTGGPTSVGNPISGGWQLVGNYFHVGGLIDNTVFTNTNISSSFWLVSAYDTRYGADNTDMVSNTDYDSFKLLAISAVSCNIDGSCPVPLQTPEPGSMALMGAAFIGMVVARRRYQKALA